MSFPHNPTGAVIELAFFEEIVDFAKRNDIIVIHDLAYADIVFDGYQAPSFLQAKGAKDVGIEFISLSKSYNMAGWRCGFAVGNRELVDALARIKGYYDYGIFAPVQVAAIMALRTDTDIVGSECGDLSGPPRCTGRRPKSNRLAGAKAAGNDVCMGTNS